MRYTTLKPSDASFSTVFRTPITSDRKQNIDVISSAVIHPNGVKVLVKFGDYTSNLSRDIRLPHFVTNDDNDHAGVCRSSHKGGRFA